MTTKQLTKLARKLYASFDIHEKVEVRQFTKGQAWSYITWGLHTLRADGKRIIWMHLKDKKGKPYSIRFLRSLLAHELAHIVSRVHGKRFRWMHRTLTRVLTKNYRRWLRA